MWKELTVVAGGVLLQIHPVNFFELDRKRHVDAKNAYSDVRQLFKTWEFSLNVSVVSETRSPVQSNHVLQGGWSSVPFGSIQTTFYHYLYSSRSLPFQPWQLLLLHGQKIQSPTDLHLSQPMDLLQPLLQPMLLHLFQPMPQLMDQLRSTLMFHLSTPSNMQFQTLTPTILVTQNPGRVAPPIFITYMHLVKIFEF